MKVAVVNDSVMASELLCRTIEADGRHELAWLAKDGAEALQRCRRDRPDILLMDLLMPNMDGVEATRRIMAEAPCAIIVVTTSIDDNAARVFEAMGAGALDAVNTPVAGPDAGSQLLDKIDLVARLIDPRPCRGARQQARETPLDAETDWLVAIGASSGGPAAASALLAGLPADLEAAYVLVQHLDPAFAPAFARWLDTELPLEVRLARAGDRPRVGTLLVGNGPHHLVLNADGRLAYDREPVDCPYHPSVDALFSSLARRRRRRCIGVLLTGMGRDGARGLLALREAGHATIAQDEASSAIYGMPKAAAELDAAGAILPLEDIGTELVRLIRGKGFKKQ
ncbi:chemotaxis-specific protein-glutamate methyltransferase CheB [Thiohalobacter sp. IOR34]|uniref:chemotaxis-specific protein-glutamate methyltransferase CheB n=1 Tax=Thiohalobacter sp. IOR34 TaxID=3057176 RepID=UPI00339D617A